MQQANGKSRPTPLMDLDMLLLLTYIQEGMAQMEETLVHLPIMWMDCGLLIGRLWICGLIAASCGGQAGTKNSKTNSYALPTADVNISPNPVVDDLLINGSGISNVNNNSIYICDTKGQIVKTATYNAGEQLPVGDLSKGSYVLIIKNEFGLRQYKFNKS